MTPAHLAADSAVTRLLDYPAVAASWRVGEGLLAKAGAGDDAFALDWYCHGAYVRTVLHQRDIKDAFAHPGGLLVLSEDSATDARELRLYRWNQLPLACP